MNQTSKTPPACFIQNADVIGVYVRFRSQVGFRSRSSVGLAGLRSVKQREETQRPQQTARRKNANLHAWWVEEVCPYYTDASSRVNGELCRLFPDEDFTGDRITSAPLKLRVLSVSLLGSVRSCVHSSRGEPERRQQ